LVFDKTLQGIENDAKRADAYFSKLHGRLENLVQMLKVADDGKGGKIYNPERKQRPRPCPCLIATGYVVANRLCGLFMA
jgi:hypothetical protein